MDTKNMDFGEAVKLMSKGKKVKRKDWSYAIYSNPQHNRILYYKHPYLECIDYLGSIIDFEAIDWMEYVEPPKKIKCKHCDGTGMILK